MQNLARSNAIIFAIVIAMTARVVGDDSDEKISPSQKLYQEDAKRWNMWVGAEKQEKAEMVKEPVFRWQNLARANGQSGAMYVWIFEGRPVVIGGVFSNPEGNRRVVMHEFHALGPERLYPEFRDSTSQWLPGAGVTMLSLPMSPAVEETLEKRSLQLRSIARDFSANTIDNEAQRWELRLLPKALYRYDKPEGNVIDGALFAFVSDAGTDPEIILALEARKNVTGASWFYRSVRLSISDLFVDYKGDRIWTSLRDDSDGPFGNKDNTYGLMRDRLIDDFPPTR